MSQELYITDWITKRLNCGQCCTRRVGDLYEIKYSLEIDSHVSYMIPDIREMLFEALHKDIIIVNHNMGVIYDDEIKGLRDGRHRLVFEYRIRLQDMK